MRIRRCASKLLGSAYSSTPSPLSPQSQLPPPPPPAATCGSGCRNGSSATTSRVICELNRSPWDLIAELDLSNSQEDVDDKYFVNITGKPSWLCNSMDVKAKDEVVEEDSEKHEVVKKVAKKKEADKKAKHEVVKKDEMEDGDSKWICKKNDGKRWHCTRQTSRPNSLCDYHLAQSRSYYNPNYENPSITATSTVTTSSKARKKKATDDVGGSNADYYYYTGFGPFRGKRRGRSGLETIDAKEEVAHEDDNSEARDDESGTHDDEFCDIAGIAGGDEESDNDVDSIGCIGNGERRGSGGNGTREKRSHRKKGRKPVKARSLKSLL